MYVENDSKINSNRLQAAVINELLTKLLDRDLRKTGSDILRFLNTADKKDYLIDYDITEDRIREIRDILTASRYTFEQEFWYSLLKATGLESDHNIFHDSELDTGKLSNLLKLDQPVLRAFREFFNFDEPVREENRFLLVKLLKELNLPFRSLNQYLPTRISFSPVFKKELDRCKNQYEAKFEQQVFEILKVNEKEQGNLQSILDDYKAFTCEVASDVIEIDYEEHFLNELINYFNGLPLRCDQLKASPGTFDLSKVYIGELTLFIEKIAPLQYNQLQLELFFNNNKMRSLLYFGNQQYLKSQFEVWLKDQGPSGKSLIPTAEVAKTFQESSDDSIKKIVTARAMVAAGEIQKGSGGRNRRIDGAASELQKMNVGLQAEIAVFQSLTRRYKYVKWMSKNATKIPKEHPGFNPEGDDANGYDIEYIDDSNSKYFVEVKGKVDDRPSFDISKSELEKAHVLGEAYKLFFVTHVLDATKRKINDLGNPFLYESGETFFNNRRFTAENKNFIIRFQYC